jgi:hypothetical protein
VARKAKGDDAAELRARVEALAGSLAAVSFVPGTGPEAEGGSALARGARIVRSKLLAEIDRGFSGPLVCAFAGGTNVGKSSLFNAILGARVSSVDARAGHTVFPTAAGPAGAREALAAFLPDYEVAEGGPPQRGRTGGRKRTDSGERIVLFSELASPGGCLAIDSPDVDSALRVHHGRADDALAASDCLAFVTSPTKYNDRRCVEFLLDAAAMGKRVLVLFNFLPPAGERARGGQGSRREVLDDFRRSVLARLPKGTSAPPLFEFDALGREAPTEEERARILTASAGAARERLAEEASAAASTKRAAAAASAKYLSRALAPALAALEEQAASLDRVRQELARAAQRAADDYESHLRSAEFLELEVVLGRLMRRFRVPVVDDILDLASAVPRRLAGAVLRRPTLEERRRERARAALVKEVELVSRVRVEFARLLEARAADEVAKVLYRGIVDVDYFARDLEAAWRQGAPDRARVLDEWLRGFEAELASRIERSPGLRATVRSLKAVLELGTGIAAAVLTGGLGAGDLLWGPAATKAAQLAVERLGREYFRSKRDEYVALARRTFEEGLDEVLLRGIRERIPGTPRAEEVEALRGELAWLARAFAAG